MPAIINIATQDILSQNLSTNVYFTLLENLAIENSVIKVGTRKSVLTNTLGIGTANLSIGNYLVEILDRKFNIAVVANVTYNLADIINLTPVTVPSAGLPTGGTTGQVLTKNSNDNYDVSWVDPNIQSIINSLIFG